MAEASQSSGPRSAWMPSKATVEHVKRKCGQFLTQAIDCLLSANHSAYTPYNFLIQQYGEEEFCTKLKLWKKPWQRALQLERAECRRCSPFGRLLIQSVSVSGSQMEGLTTLVPDTLWESDEDMMVVLGPVHWASDSQEIRETTEAAGTTDSSGTPRLSIAPTGHPGFVRVLQQRQPDCQHSETLPFSADDVRQFFSELMLAVEPPDAELGASGPAISFVKAEFLALAPEESVNKFGPPNADRVPCLHVRCWPSEEFFTRCRESGWPPEASVEDMKLFGLHLVPVGAPGSPTERYEWRWSFSRAEAVTAEHLGSVPKCAIRIIKGCKSVADLQGKSLKSYFVKTAVFWLCQAQGGQPWESVSQCVLQILDYLEKALTKKRLSCFYLKDSNILELTQREERRATLRTVRHIRRNITSLLIQLNWPLLRYLLQELQGRLSEAQMRVAVVRVLIRHGVLLSRLQYYSVFASHLDQYITFAALSSNTAEVCSMFRQLITPWFLKSSLFHALMIAPREVASQIPLKATEGGDFFWDVAPLMALLTEDDLKEMLEDPDAVRSWLRRQHRLPETERPGGLPADLRSPRDLCDLLINIPLLVSVLTQSVPGCRRRMESHAKLFFPLQENHRLSFAALRQMVLEDAGRWIHHGHGLLFHIRLGVDKELALKRTKMYLHLLKEFCDDPTTRDEHDRLRNAMPDSWQLRPLVFSGAGS